MSPAGAWHRVRHEPARQQGILRHPGRFPDSGEPCSRRDQARPTRTALYFSAEILPNRSRAAWVSRLAADAAQPAAATPCGPSADQAHEGMSKYSILIAFNDHSTLGAGQKSLNFRIRRPPGTRRCTLSPGPTPPSQKTARPPHGGSCAAHRARLQNASARHGIRAHRPRRRPPRR